MVHLRKRHSRPNLVLALGNWYQQDDAVALVVLNRLKKHITDRVVLQATEEAGLTLLEFLVGFHQVILLDAFITTEEEGKVLEMQPNDFQVHAMAAWHQMGIPEVLQVGKELRLPMPRNVVLLGITVNHCNWGVEGICRTLQHKLPEIEREVVGFIHKTFQLPQATPAPSQSK